jgi:hypothetical protein
MYPIGPSCGDCGQRDCYECGDGAEPGSMMPSKNLPKEITTIVKIGKYDVVYKQTLKR